MFDGAYSPDVQPPDDPVQDPPLGTVEEEAAKSQPQTETEPGEEVKPLEGTPPAAATPKPAEPAKLWAGKFQKPEDLEVAYAQSSKEGQRLAQEVSGRKAELEKLLSEKRELELKVELGPEPKELTKEELDAMTPNDVARYYSERSERKIRVEQIKKEREAQAKQEKVNDDARVSHIVNRASQMEKDVENFPDYKDLHPLMDEIMDVEPGVRGLRRTPEILYFAAFGMRALQAARKGKTETAAAEKIAKDKAAADTSRAAGPGPTPSEKIPGSGADANDDSDEAHNLRLIRAQKRPILNL